MPSTPNAPAPKGPKPPEGTLGSALGLGTELAAAMVLGVLAGLWADRRLGTAPAFLLVGAAAGFAAGLYLVIRSAKHDPPRRG